MYQKLRKYQHLNLFYSIPYQIHRICLGPHFDQILSRSCNLFSICSPAPQRNYTVRGQSNVGGLPKNCPPPPPPPAGEGIPPPPLVRGEDTLARGRGGGVNSSEDTRHCSVLYICKYFVSSPINKYKVESNVHLLNRTVRSLLNKYNVVRAAPNPLDRKSRLFCFFSQSGKDLR